MISIRAATDKDVPQMLEIYNEIIENSTAIFQYEPRTLAMHEEWFSKKKMDGYPVLVAEHEFEVVGFSTFGQFRNWQAYQFTVENSVYVRADKRGVGIGKLLLAASIDAARKMGLHSIIASVVADNKASLLLHKGFGFKFNRWLDLCFLQLMLA